VVEMRKSSMEEQQAPSQFHLQVAVQALVAVAQVDTLVTTPDFPLRLIHRRVPFLIERAAQHSLFDTGRRYVSCSCLLASVYLY
jgi:hypothetical protein